MAVSIESILADEVSGASEIEGSLLGVLQRADDEEAAVLLRTLPRRLVEVFPQMANVLELARQMTELSDEQTAGGVATAQEFRVLLENRIEERKKKDHRLSTIVIPYLPEGDLLVFTLSKSGTVASVLYDLAAAGRRLCVLVAESRPGAEGARMARELADRGIRTRTCDDFLLLSLVPPEAASRRPAGYAGNSVVLVGADAVHPDGLVNKVGTRALLDTSRRAGVPAFVLATSSKLRRESAPTALGSLFETIPRDEITVLTETGPAKVDV